VTLKLHGSVRLYSGGQRGRVSKLYAWASFPDAGARQAGKSQVIPMTITRKGNGQSELSAALPQSEGNLFTIAELLVSIRRSVRVEGRSVPVMIVRCPSGASSGEVWAEASFYGPTAPITTGAKSTCKS
jgi:hypothetical protein